MLYWEIRWFIKKKPFKIRENVLTLTQMKTKNFIDVLKLYIELMSILNDIWETSLTILSLHIRENREESFNKDYFNRMLLEKGSLMTNENILKNVLLKAASYIEWYMEQFLVEKPEYRLFKEFSNNNFTQIAKVFNNKYMDDTEYLFTYKRWNEVVYVKDKTLYTKFDKTEMWYIYDSYTFDNSLREYFFKLADYNFSIWRKFVLEAIETQYKWFDIMWDSDYMTRLWTEVDRLEKLKKDE